MSENSSSSNNSESLNYEIKSFSDKNDEYNRGLNINSEIELIAGLPIYDMISLNSPKSARSN